MEERGGDVAHSIRETGVLGLGVLLLANPMYLSILRNTAGIGYVDSPIMTRTGMVYVGIGAVLLGFRYAGFDVTIRLAGLASLGGVVVYLASVTTAGHGPFSVSTYAAEVSFWFPRVVLVASLFPLGVADTRLQRGIVGGGMAVAILWMFLDAYFPSSPHGIGGPLFAAFYTTIFTAGAFVIGLPLYYVGKQFGHQNRAGGTGRSSPSSST